MMKLLQNGKFVCKKMSFLLVFILFAFSAHSQNITVTGKITDGSGEGLLGASVVVVGTSTGTVTDIDGTFSITAGAGESLQFDYLGYLTQVMPIDGRTVINVTLLDDTEQLDEVVVVGYGRQSRAEVTGAISTITSKELTALPVTSAAQSMQGRVSGITVINNGSPGANPVVKVRGLGTTNNSDPLYVIDGVFAGGLGDVNPEDIESINVLKDASTTAIYGSQGSNGVIIITTKKGTKGKAKVSFNTYAGMQNTSQRYDVLNTQQYLQYAKDAFGVEPNTPQVNSGLNTNWQDEIFRTGMMNNYDLSVSGGGENSDFRISGGYLNQEGIIINTSFKRYSLRTNSNFKAGRFSVGENIGITFNDRTAETTGGGRSLIEHAIKSAPYLPVYNENNKGGFQGPNSAGDGQDAENPVRIQNLGDRSNTGTSILGNVYAGLKIIDGLNLKSQLSLQYTTFNNNSFRPSYDDDSEGGATHASAFAAITKNSGINQNIVITNSLNYDKTLSGVHNLNVLLLQETTNINNSNLNANSRNSISDEVNQVTLDDAALTSSSSEANRLSYLGRVNYSYNGKYILAGSLRRDASSRFGANNRWGTFPSVAVGWNIAKEDFMSGLNMDQLKLRGSWGVTGNDRIGDYQYSSTLTSNFFYPINGNAATGTTSNGLANQDLKWEEVSMLNVGIDAGFWDNRITTSLEFYNNTSDDLLLNRALPVSLGFHQPFISENVGSVETKGVEFDFALSDYEGDFTWTTRVNLGTSRNTVLSLGQVEELTGGGFENGNISRTIVGEPMFHFYGLVTDGIYQSQAEVDAVFTADPGQTTVAPGDIRFKDLNGDGAITSADRDIIGNPYPKLTYGLNFDASYKAWDFVAFINGVAGNDIYNTNIYDLQGMPRNFNAGVAVLDRWTTPGQVTEVPRAGGAPQNLAISDRFVESGAYTRLKNISIGYTFSGDAISKYLSNLRVYVSGQNLVTLTDYSGFDPEVGNFGGGNTGVGIDRGNYPQPKSFLVGAKVNF